MSDKVFLDTNIWVYLYSEDAKSLIAEQLIHQHFGNIVLSTQVLGECFTVLTRKKLKTSRESEAIIHDMISACGVTAIQKDSVFKAIAIHLRYQYSYYDSLIIASALENKCSVLYSEDMSHAQLIEDKVKIVNPFMPKFKNGIGQSHLNSGQG